ncbi:formate hydrogenlyase [Candidatus Parcubacteria bacterium]|nr:MAG: formate hydrogenlyase [Candidatus Parcubacteria bacterium]
MEILFYAFQSLAIPLASPAVLGLIRKIKAYMQGRQGASIMQPYRDLAKLLRKDEVVSEDNSWIFSAAPYIIFGTTLALAISVPLIANFGFAPTGDILVFVYVLAAGTFFLALAGMDTGGGFGGFGASREMMIAALAEGGLILSLVAASFLAGEHNLAAMPSQLATIPLTGLLPLFLAGGAFFIALLAENARYPVDNPATHLELTMVHEAMILEYSGPKLALMEWAAANKLLIYIAVLVNVFFPWGLAVSIAPSALAVAFGIFTAKVFAVAAVIAFIESTMAKFRIFRVPDFLFTSFVLSAIAIILIVL